MSEISVVQALAAVAEDVRQVRKDSRNSSQNFNFRGIDAVMNAVGPAFRKHGVLCLPVTEDVRYEPMPLSSGKSASRCVVTVTYRFFGPAGDSIEAKVVGESFDMGDKATAKAYSVAYRTCLLQTLTIPTDDPDPDHDVYERAPAREFGAAQSTTLDPLATAEQVGTIKASLAMLTPPQVDDLQGWWKDNGLPSMKSGRLTKRQAAVILDRLQSLNTVEGGDPAPEGSVGTGRETTEVSSGERDAVTVGSPEGTQPSGTPSAAAREALGRAAKR